MIFEIKKAIEALLHPGMKTNLFALIRNAVPYYLSPNLNAFNPLTIYIAINSVCNMQCKMCDIGQDNLKGTYYKRLCPDDAKPQISIEVFKDIINDVSKFRPHIAICATEPLLYKDLPVAIEYCKRFNVPVTVTTNGYNLDKRAGELVDAGLESLVVSLDGPASVHNHIRGRNDVFERAVTGVESFKRIANNRRRKVHITTSCVINNHNYMRLAEFASICQKLPFDEINIVHMWFISSAMAKEHNSQFSSIFSVTESCLNEDVRLQDINPSLLYQQLQLVKEFRNAHVLGEYDIHQLGMYYGSTDAFLNPRGKCMAPWFFTQILSNGDVVPFSRCPASSFGSVNEDSILKIWNGKKYKSWRTFIKKYGKTPACKRCDLIG